MCHLGKAMPRKKSEADDGGGMQNRKWSKHKTGKRETEIPWNPGAMIAWRLDDPIEEPLAPLLKGEDGRWRDGRRWKVSVEVKINIKIHSPHRREESWDLGEIIGLLRDSRISPPWEPWDSLSRILWVLHPGNLVGWELIGPSCTQILMDNKEVTWINVQASIHHNIAAFTIFYLWDPKISLFIAYSLYFTLFMSAFSSSWWSWVLLMFFESWRQTRFLVSFSFPIGLGIFSHLASD